MSDTDILRANFTISDAAKREFDAQLQEIYRKGDADIGFRGEELRYFLGLVRATIDRDA